MRRFLTVPVATALCAGLLTGCGSSGLYGTPLPGGADLGAHSYHVTAQFADVLDLVPQASVRLNDVAVGRVDQISLAPDGSVALVAMTINGDAVLPANTHAELSSASLLGEKFVQLVPPSPAPPGGQPTAGGATSQPVGRLADGAVIPVADTRRYPEVEEVFGALSLLLNGGGLAQAKDIVHELNTATGGNEAQLRDLLSQMARLTGQLDAQRATIVQAIDGLDRLSTVVAGQTGHINTALEQLGPGLAVLNQQRDQLVDLLKSLDRLSGVATDTVHRSRDDLVADLRALYPTLKQLADSGDELPKTLPMLLAFGFTDDMIKTIKGDYINIDVTLKVDTADLGNILRSSQLPVPVPGTPGNPLPGVLGQIITKPLLPETKPPAGLGGLLLPAAPSDGSDTGGSGGNR